MKNKASEEIIIILDTKERVGKKIRSQNTIFIHKEIIIPQSILMKENRNLIRE